jgi:hypothetical protein
MVYLHPWILILLLPWGSLSIKPWVLSFAKPGSLALAADLPPFLANHPILLPPVARLMGVIYNRRCQEGVNRPFRVHSAISFD